MLQSTTMSGNMNADITVCVFGGIILAFPFIIWQLWGFIKPGLKEKETKSVRGIVFYVSLLFFTGVAFAYFLLAPLSIQFLGNYTFADVQNTPTLLSYLKLTTTLVFGTGLVFQLPVIIYFLSRIGIVTADFLRKYRRHAFVINLIIAAIITPPDVTSQILVSLPMLLLYEVSILVAARAEKRTAQ
jgi:sec-independent protein translocase protein TatC